MTYPRDIVVQTGGGWVDYVSAMNVAYGITGGSGSGPVHAGGANSMPIVQANMEKGLYKAHVFAAALRVMFVDMQKANYIGRAGGSTKWADKTPKQILDDVNRAITAVWAAAEYDESAIPNHILLPYEQYTYILNTMVTDIATETIMDYIMKNNIAAKNGGSLYIGATRWCKGAGTGDSDRMAVYVNHERFVKIDELVPLARIMTAPNAAEACYDTAYMANLSEVQVFYSQTLAYYDGI